MGTDVAGFEPATTDLEGRCPIRTRPHAHNKIFFLLKDETLRGRFELPPPLRRTGSQGRRGRPCFATSADYTDKMKGK